MSHSRSKHFAVEMYLNITKWQAFQHFLQKRTMTMLCHLPLMQTLSTVCTAIWIILIFKYFSKSISSASNCWISGVIQEATDHTRQELLRPLTGGWMLRQHLWCYGLTCGTCTGQPGLRHPLIVLEKPSTPTLLPLFICAHLGNMHSFERQWQHLPSF